MPALLYFFSISPEQREFGGRGQRHRERDVWEKVSRLVCVEYENLLPDLRFLERLLRSQDRNCVFSKVEDVNLPEIQESANQ